MLRVPRPLNVELYRGIRTKRCDGQLKRFSSCQDIRAWSLNKYERQCYMRDMLASSCDSSEYGSDEDPTYSHKLPLSTLLSALLVSKKITEDSLKEKIRELNSDLEKYRQGSQPENSLTISTSKNRNIIKESNQDQSQKLPTEDNEVNKGVSLQKEDGKEVSDTKTNSENQQITQEINEIQSTENINNKPKSNEGKDATSENNDSEFAETPNTDNEAPESTEESLAEPPISEINDTTPLDSFTLEATIKEPSCSKSSLEESVIEEIVQEKSQSALLEEAPIPKEPTPETPSPKQLSDDKNDMKNEQGKDEDGSDFEVTTKIFEYLSTTAAINENPFLIYLAEFTAESNTKINEKYTDITPSEVQIPREIPIQMDLDQKFQYENEYADDTDSESVNRCSLCGKERNYDDYGFSLPYLTPKYKNITDAKAYYSYSPMRTLPVRDDELQRARYYQNPINSSREPHKSATTSKRMNINEDFYNSSHLSRNKSHDIKQNPQRFVNSEEPKSNIYTKKVNLRIQHPHSYEWEKIRPQECIPPPPRYKIPSDIPQHQVRSSVPVYSEFYSQLYDKRHIHSKAPLRAEYNPWHHRIPPKCNPEVSYAKQLNRKHQDVYSQCFRYHDYC